MTIEQGVSPFAIKHSFERIQVAAQLKNIRRLEQSKETREKENYKIDRTAWDYNWHLLGLSQLFEYVRSLPNGHTVLDIGAGTSKGTAGLANSPMGRGLSFLATGLSYSPDIEKYIGRDRYRITPAETMRGIPDGSIGAALALYSIGYSEAPSQAIKRIDDVLVPGGVVKAAFRPNDDGDRSFNERNRYKTHVPFLAALKALRYSTETANGLGNVVLLAIKPGGPGNMTAAELIREGYERSLTTPANLEHVFGIAAGFVLAVEHAKGKIVSLPKSKGQFNSSKVQDKNSLRR